MGMKGIEEKDQNQDPETRGRDQNQDPKKRVLGQNLERETKGLNLDQGTKAQGPGIKDPNLNPEKEDHHQNKMMPPDQEKKGQDPGQKNRNREIEKEGQDQDQKTKRGPREGSPNLCQDQGHQRESPYLDLTGQHLDRRNLQ